MFWRLFWSSRIIINLLACSNINLFQATLQKSHIFDNLRSQYLIEFESHKRHKLISELTFLAINRSLLQHTRHKFDRLRKQTAEIIAVLSGIHILFDNP